MKRFLIPVIGVLALLTTNPVIAKEFYIEGSIGHYDVDDVDTTRASGTESGITFTNFGGSLEYDADTTLGFEIGVKFNEKVRIGFSYVDASLDFEGANVTGSATDGTTTINVNARVTPANASALGLTFSNDAELMMIKAYYDFNTFSNGLTPFVGIGIGQADIDNATDDETIIALTAGARYNLNDKAYVGAKVSYMEIDGPDDGLGIQYEDIELTSFEVVVGISF
jgi:opacity protein-like surface antigen